MVVDQTRKSLEMWKENQEKERGKIEQLKVQYVAVNNFIACMYVDVFYKLLCVNELKASHS